MGTEVGVSWGSLFREFGLPPSMDNNPGLSDGLKYKGLSPLLFYSVCGESCVCLSK